MDTRSNKNDKKELISKTNDTIYHILDNITMDHILIIYFNDTSDLISYQKEKNQHKKHSISYAIVW